MSIETTTRIKVNNDIAEPPMYKVIYLNDNQTTMEFVVDSLITHFNYNNETAEKLTIDIHDAGAATVAVLPFEIAEQKGVEVTLEARQQGFPFQVRLEQDN